jgi:hypothetical protein
MRGQQQQRRPDALAAAFAQVLGDLGDGADAGGGVAAQFLLHRDEVFPQQLKDLSRRGYRECAQSAPILMHRQGGWRLACACILCVIAAADVETAQLVR